MNFEDLYRLVKGIVRKTFRDYYIKLWEWEDWEQEGMIILYELITLNPELMINQEKLYSYYKVKFKNYIIDMVRKQESQKRRFDRMNHEEISEIAYEVKANGLNTDELVILRQQLSDFKKTLSINEKEQYDKYIRGERFQGRKAIEKKLRDYLSAVE